MNNLENVIVKWWNKNAFCGYLIECVKDIKEVLEECSFKSIEELISYYVYENEKQGTDYTLKEKSEHLDMIKLYYKNINFYREEE